MLGLCQLAIGDWYSPRTSLTRHCFNIVGRMHGHHFGIDPYPILIVRVQIRWQLYERQRRLTVWVEVFLQRVSTDVYVVFVHTGRFLGRIYQLVETHLVQNLDADGRGADNLYCMCLESNLLER